MYRPTQPPGNDSLKDLSDWASDEFGSVADGLQNLDRIRLAEAHVEPPKKRDGDVVFADGSDWNPGDGRGIYVYFGGAWNKMGFDPGAGTITGSVGSTDNRLIRSSGTSGTVLDSTGITVDDTNNVSGVVGLSLTSIDLGNADATLSRFGAGDAQVEGNRIFRVGGTDVPVADGGTGASDATNARINLGSGLALLASGAAANQTSLDLVLTSYTAYRGLIFELTLLPITDGVDLNLLFSTDGGANYLTAGYNDAMVVTADSGSAVGQGSGSAARIPLNLATANNQVGNGSTEGWHGTIKILKQTDTAFWSRVNFQGYYISNAATPAGMAVQGGGAQETAEDTDAIRIIPSSGNLTYSYAIYGMH